MNDLKIELSVIGVQQALARINRLTSGMRGLSQQQKQLNAQAQLLRAQINLQKAVQGSGGSSFAQRLGNVLKSSRIGISGGGISLMPLLGQLGALLGPEGEAATLIIGGAVAISTSLYEAAQKAADLALSFEKMRFTAGGTPVQTAQLSSLSGLLGTNTAELARSFADALASGGFASGFGARAGIHDYGLMDTTNKAQKLLQAIDYIRQATEKEALRFTRATGTESLLPMRNLSEQSIQQMKQTAALNEAVMSPEVIKDAENMKSAINDVSVAFNTAFVEFVKVSGIMKVITTTAIGASESLKYVTFGLAALQDMFSSDKTHLSSLIKTFEAAKNAMNRHTDAMDDHSRAIREGLYGGGERARGAVPGKWRGMNAEQWGAQAARLGAFAM